MDNHIGVLDIETLGGFTHKDGFICEIGISAINLKTWEITTIFDSVCKHPDLRAKHQKSWIFENSSLTVEDVRKAPFLSEIQTEVQHHINQFELGMVSFNVKFDFPYMKGFGFEFGKILPDPMLVLTPIMKLPKKNGKRGNKWPSVVESYHHYLDLPDYEEMHRAGPDSFDEAGLIVGMIQRGDYKI